MVSITARLLMPCGRPSVCSPDEYLFGDTLVVFAKRDTKGIWNLRYVWSDDHWATGSKSEAELIKLGSRATGIKQESPSTFSVPMESSKGFSAELNISMSCGAELSTFRK